MKQTMSIGEKKRRKVNPVWNKGLTKETDKRVEKISISNKGKIISEETKIKISLKLKGRGKGIPLSEETKQKMRKPKSEAHKKKISETRKKLFAEGILLPSLKGKHHSRKTREKIGLSNKGRLSPFKGKCHSKKTIKKMILNHKGMEGKTHSLESIKKIGEFRKGKTHPAEVRMKMRMSAIKYIIETRGNISPNIGKNEKQILDKIEKRQGYKVIRQYFVKGYFVDGYCKEKNIVFEVDEKQKNKPKDIEREKIIKKELNCIFRRIPTY